jgi:hypothetical protein
MDELARETGNPAIDEALAQVDEGAELEERLRQLQAALDQVQKALG